MFFESLRYMRYAVLGLLVASILVVDRPVWMERKLGIVLEPSYNSQKGFT